MQLVDNYDGFEKEFLKVLNNHAPLKKKFIRANHVPYMTKALHKAIMKRSQLESKYYRDSTVENGNKYEKQKSFCSKLYKKEKKKFYSNLDIKNVTDNRLFWKTMKPFLSDKCTHTPKISLFHEGNVIFDDLELAKTINNFFENAVDDLEIKDYENDVSLHITSTDPIDSAIMKYPNHPSIIMINENMSFQSRFKFKVLNENNIQCEILKLNSKKAGTFGNISTLKY